MALAMIVTSLNVWLIAQSDSPPNLADEDLVSATVDLASCLDQDLGF